MIDLNRIIALKKDGSLIMFDDRAEFEKCNIKEYRRIWADGKAIIISLYHAEDEADELRTELACYEL
jgi:hypothetical protein